MNWIPDLKQLGSKQKQKQKKKTKTKHCWTTDLYLPVFGKNWQAIKKCASIFLQSHNLNGYVGTTFMHIL